jgi:sulfatase maturation enzyme AslB (radical SAM superfamily)
MLMDEMNAIRGGKVYDGVVRNCHRLIETRKRSGGETQLVACIVVQEINAHSVVETARFLLDEVGFDRIVIQPMHRYHSVSWDNYRDAATLQRSPCNALMLTEVQRIFEAAVQEPRMTMVGGSLAMWTSYYHDPLSIPGECRAPGYLFVDAYGKLRGCVVGVALGDIHQMSLHEFLESQAYERFMQMTKHCKICLHPCS